MKHEKILIRENGDTVTIIHIGIFNDITNSVEVYSIFVKVKANDGDTKFYYPTPYNPSLEGLSVEEYIKRGRKGIMSMVRPHELLKASLEFKEALGHSN